MQLSALLDHRESQVLEIWCKSEYRLNKEINLQFVHWIISSQMNEAYISQMLSSLGDQTNVERFLSKETLMALLQDFSTGHFWHLGLDNSVLQWVAMCIVECLVVSVASSTRCHWHSFPLSFDNKKHLQNCQISPGGQIIPGGNDFHILSLRRPPV